MSHIKLAEAYPLQWPVGEPRTPIAMRRRARFSDRGTAVSIAAGLDRLLYELNLLGARHTTVSTNVPVRLDGLPYSRATTPDDPGVAVYFTLDDRPTVFACDKWDRIGDNIAAIAAYIKALRGQERWGVGSRAQAFAGFRLLSGATPVKSWWEVLGFAQPPADYETVDARFHQYAQSQHPDRGGSTDQMAALTSARDAARAYYQPRS